MWSIFWIVYAFIVYIVVKSGTYISKSWWASHGWWSDSSWRCRTVTGLLHFYWKSKTTKNQLIQLWHFQSFALNDSEKKIYWIAHTKKMGKRNLNGFAYYFLISHIYFMLKSIHPRDHTYILSQYLYSILFPMYWGNILTFYKCIR